jgi:3-isopropylmalate/(R)-2-methylmalate dehydratase small subunit
MSAHSDNGSVFETRTFNLPVDNIDTDQIIPAQFLTTTTREGLGQYCFYGWRFNEARPRPAAR